MDRLPANAADVVRLGVDIIVATGTNPNVVAAMKATTTIPIVMTSGVDPVSAGLIASLARPGGNVTGLASDAGGEMNGKRFELLKETLPNLSRLGILFNPDNALRTRQTSMGETARVLGLTLVPVEISPRLRKGVVSTVRQIDHPPANRIAIASAIFWPVASW